MLSLAYTIFNYSIQLVLVEIYGYKFRGLLEVLMSIIGLASVIFSFNFYTAINLYTSKNKGAPKNLGKIGSIIILVQLMVVIFIFVISTKDESIKKNLSAVLLFPLICATLLNHKVNEFTAILNGHQYFIRAKIMILTGALFTAVSIGALYNFNLENEYIVMCVVLVGPFLGAFIYYRLLKIFDKKLTTEFGNLSFKALYINNRGIYIISLSQFVAMKMYLLLLTQIGSLEVVGIFSFAYSITQVVALPATFLATIALSSETDDLYPLIRPFFVVMIYSIAAGTCLKIGIALDLMGFLPLSSMKAPAFVSMLNLMTLSIPFSVLNILVVAVAIRLNELSTVFIFNQIMLLPVLALCFFVLKILLPLEQAIAGSYTIALLLVSVIGLVTIRYPISGKKRL